MLRDRYKDGWNGMGKLKEEIQKYYPNDFWQKIESNSMEVGVFSTNVTRVMELRMPKTGTKGTSSSHLTQKLTQTESWV